MNSTTASCIGSEKIVIDESQRNTRVLKIIFHCVKDGIALLCAPLAIESINYGIDLVIPCRISLYFPALSTDSKCLL